MTDLVEELTAVLMRQAGCKRGQERHVPQGAMHDAWSLSEDEKDARGWVIEDTGFCDVHDACQWHDSLRGEWVDEECSVARAQAEALLPLIESKRKASWLKGFMLTPTKDWKRR